MSDTTKNKWIAVVLSIIVIGIFFGGYTFYSSNRQLDTQDVNSLNLDQTLPSNENISTTSLNQIIINNKTKMTTQENGLQITDIVVGTGAEAKAGNNIEVNYLGTLEDGTKFDSSYDRGQPLPFTLGVGQVIQGWDEGVAGMKVGGKRKLVIPAALAYGDRGAGNIIKPGATLVFEVELVAVK